MAGSALSTGGTRAELVLQLVWLETHAGSLINFMSAVELGSVSAECLLRKNNIIRQVCEQNHQDEFKQRKLTS